MSAAVLSVDSQIVFSIPASIVDMMVFMNYVPL